MLEIINALTTSSSLLQGVVALGTILGGLYVYMTKYRKKFSLLNPNLDVFDNYDQMKKKLFVLIDEEINHKKHVSIKNIGLDLEYSLPDIGDYISKLFETDKTISLEFKGLLVNPKSPAIEPLIGGSSNINSKFVDASFQRVINYNNFFKNSGISFQIAQYDYPLIIHGFLVGKTHLFLGFTELKEGKIFGSDKSYIYLKYDKKIEATRHYFDFFENWFEYHYNKEMQK